MAYAGIPTLAPTSTRSHTPTPAPTSTHTPDTHAYARRVAAARQERNGRQRGDHGSLVISETPVPTPVFPLELPGDTINVLLLGSDNRPGEALGRADTIIVASINPPVRLRVAAEHPARSVRLLFRVSISSTASTPWIFTPTAPSWASRRSCSPRRVRLQPRHSGALLCAHQLCRSGAR